MEAKTISSSALYDSPVAAEPIRSERIRMWHVWSDDPRSTAVPELWKVWATDPGLAVLAVRQQLQQVRDDWAVEVIAVVETMHEFELAR